MAKDEKIDMQFEHCPQFDVVNYIDWEGRRYEIAKRMLPFCAEVYDQNMKAYAAAAAIEYADVLIKMLKTR